MARRSTLMRRGSQRAGTRGGGGGSGVLLLFALVAAVIGTFVWYFALGGPGTKKNGIPGSDYAPTPPTVNINVPKV